MVIVSIMIMLMVIGFFLLTLTEMIPIFQLMQMEWIAAIIIAIPTILLPIRLMTSKSLQIFEKKIPGHELVFFLRRDGIVEPMYASRPFHGESFLDLKKVGLIHDLGKGSVYRLGDKNIRFVLENVNHTPDPKYMNYTKWLYDTGFNNMREIQMALNGEETKEILEKLPVYEAKTGIEDMVDRVIMAEEKEKEVEVKKNEGSYAYNWLRNKKSM